MADKTIEELRSTYPGLVAQIEKIARGEENQASIIVEIDATGNIAKWIEEIRDIESNTLIQKRIDEYSYYKNGEIDTITQQVFDSKGMISVEQIKHFTDGRKPERSR